ncbi:MAG: hypothetical protein MMC33_009420 [Icmadophila ericetorum]|nr:hypothetical protein [Icmadophila ericetorum]
MVPSLMRLPKELHLEVIEMLHKEGHSLLNMSSTCSFYRSLLASYVFRDIHFHNTKKNSASVLALTKSDCRKHVQTLDFTCILSYIEDNSDNSDEDREETNELENDGNEPTAAARDKKYDDPVAVYIILSDLRRFPHLHTLSMELRLDQAWDKNVDLGIFYMFADDESHGQAEEAERDVPWRAQVKRVYTSLAQNTESPIKELDIRNLMPREVTTWKTPDFHRFLGTLERFKLSLMGGENGTGWHINTQDGYIMFTEKLDGFFFNHLSNVLDFTFKPDETGPVGLEGMRHCDLALSSDQMPHLRTLFLENVFICPELVSFIVSHAEILQSVTFHNCFGSIEGMARNGIYWERLFTLWADSNPQKLQHLEILPYENIFEYEFETSNDDGYEAEIERTRQMLEENSKRRHFEYKYLDDKYGMVFRDDREVRSSFFRGGDQQAYGRLMNIVKSNVEGYVSTE